MSTDWEIVHCHQPFGLGVVAQKLALRRNLPCIATYHTKYPDYARVYANWAPQPILQPLLKRHLVRFFNRCDLVIAPSHATAQHIRDIGITSRVEVLPTAVPVASFVDSWPESQLAIRAELAIATDAPVIVSAGRIAREKNLELAFTAFAQLRARHPTAIFVVVGGGPALQHYQDYAKHLGINHAVRFTGSIPPHTVPKYLAIGHAFVFVSETDTQGLVVVESLACGRPVVTTTTSVGAESIQHGTDGVVVEPNAVDLAHILGQLIENTEWHGQLSANALERARQRSPGVHAAQLVEFYTQIRTSRGLA